MATVSTVNELEALNPNWSDDGLTWDEFGTCSQTVLEGFKNVWFPNDIARKAKVQNIWARHPVRQSSGGSQIHDIVKQLTDKLSETTDVLERATKLIKELEKSQRRAILDFVSTGTGQERYQRNQKAFARDYYGCVDPSDSTRTVCMVTGVLGIEDQVMCAYILPVRAKSRMTDFDLRGINMWNECNCLLLAKPIEEKMDRGEVVFLFDQADGCYKLHVVYQEVLSQNLEKGDFRITKKDLGLSGENETAVFGDIHGRKLNYPSTCPGPYHRIMLYMAKMYLQEAEECDISDLVPGVVPTREKWISLKNHVLTLSPESKNSIAMKRFLNDVQ